MTHEEAIAEVKGLLRICHANEKVIDVYAHDNIVVAYTYHPLDKLAYRIIYVIREEWVDFVKCDLL